MKYTNNNLNTLMCENNTMLPPAMRLLTERMRDAQKVRSTPI
jgi:hypothetical protein